MKYLNLSPEHWYLIEQNHDKVAYRFKPNPFVDLEIQPDGTFDFIGYGAYTENPRLVLSAKARIEATEIAECHANA